MAIVLNDNIDNRSPKPPEVKMQVADLASRDLIDSNYRWEGLTTYVIAEEKIYYLKGGITNSDWTELGGGFTPSDLQTDYSLSGSSVDDVIKWDGTEWIVGSAPGGSTPDLQDVMDAGSDYLGDADIDIHIQDSISGNTSFKVTSERALVGSERETILELKDSGFDLDLINSWQDAQTGLGASSSGLTIYHRYDSDTSVGYYFNIDQNTGYTFGRYTGPLLRFDIDSLNSGRTVTWGDFNHDFTSPNSGDVFTFDGLNAGWVAPPSLEDVLNEDSTAIVTTTTSIQSNTGNTIILNSNDGAGDLANITITPGGSNLTAGDGSQTANIEANNANAFLEHKVGANPTFGIKADTNGLQIYEGAIDLLFDTTNLTADRSLIFPDGDIDMSGGADGQVLTVQADGSIQVETLPAGGFAQNLSDVFTEGNTAADDLELTGSANGVILESPDSTRWRIQVDNSGNLTTTSL